MTDELKDDPLLAGLAARKARALGNFNRLNTGRANGEPAYAPPPLVELESKLDTVIAQLVAKGDLDLHNVLIEALQRECEALEASLAGATEHKRRTTGLIVPSGNGNGR